MGKYNKPIFRTCLFVSATLSTTLLLSCTPSIRGISSSSNGGAPSDALATAVIAEFANTCSRASCLPADLNRQEDSGQDSEPFSLNLSGPNEVFSDVPVVYSVTLTEAEGSEKSVSATADIPLDLTTSGTGKFLSLDTSCQTEIQQIQVKKGLNNASFCFKGITSGNETLQVSRGKRKVSKTLNTRSRSLGRGGTLDAALAAQAVGEDQIFGGFISQSNGKTLLLSNLPSSPARNPIITLNFFNANFTPDNSRGFPVLPTGMPGAPIGGVPLRDGSIILVGHFPLPSDPDGTRHAQLFLEKINPDGSLNESLDEIFQRRTLTNFSPNLKVERSIESHQAIVKMSLVGSTSNLDLRVDAVVEQPDGKILVGVVLLNPTFEILLMRFAPDGTLDPSLSATGVIHLSEFSSNSIQGIRGLGVLPNGDIVVAGLKDPRTSSEVVLVRRNSSGDSLSSSTLNTGLLNAPTTTSQILAVQPDGKWIVVGCANPCSAFKAKRFKMNGSSIVQDSFSNGVNEVVTDVLPSDSGSKKAHPSAVLVQPDGKFLIAGYSRGSSSEITMHVVRYLPNGDLDRLDSNRGSGFQFELPGALLDNGLRLGLQPDGKILVGGQVDSIVQGTSRSVPVVLRLLPGELWPGALDATFGGAALGRVQTEVGGSVFRVSGITTQPDGKILVAGTFRDSTTLSPSISTDDPKKTFLSRFNKDGSLDSTFGTSGKTTLNGGFPLEVLVHSNGSIFVPSLLNDFSRSVTITRLSPKGELDTQYGNQGISEESVPFLSALGFPTTSLQSAGRVVVLSGPILQRFTSSGFRDPSFGDPSTGVVDVGINGRMLLLPDQTILVAGNLRSGGNGFVFRKLSADGKLETTFGDQGTVTLSDRPVIFPFDLALQPDGKVIASFLASDNGSFFPSFVRIDSKGVLDPTVDAIHAKIQTLGSFSNKVYRSPVLAPLADRLVLGTGDLSRSLTQGLALQFLAFKTDGALEPSFAGGPAPQIPYADMSIQPTSYNIDMVKMLPLPDGQILVARPVPRSQGEAFFDLSLIRLLP